MALNILHRLWPSTPAITPERQPQRNEHGHLIVKVTGLDLIPKALSSDSHGIPLRRFF
jgi:hypothetical protein